MVQRIVFLVLALLLGDCAWNTMKSAERASELQFALSLDTPVKLSTLYTYINDQDINTFYPSYYELILFLRILKSMNKQDITEASPSVFSKANHLNKEAIFRLLDFPPSTKKFNAVALLLRSEVVKDFVKTFDSPEIPMSFYEAIDIVCREDRDVDYCKKRDKFIADASHQKYNYRDVKMFLNTVKNDFTLNAKTQSFLINFPLIYDIFVEDMSLLQLMLENYKEAEDILYVSPVPYITLKRVDDRITCEDSLLHFVNDANSSFYKSIHTYWGQIIEGCVNGINTAAARTVYSHYEKHYKVLYSAMEFSDGKSTLMDNFRAWEHGQYMLALYPLMIAVERHSFQTLCQLLNSNDALAHSYWNPRKNRFSLIMDLWGTAESNQCGKSLLRKSIVQFSKIQSEQKIGFPAQISLHCFTVSISASDNQAMGEYYSKPDDMLYVARHQELTAKIRKENEWRFKKSRDCYELTTYSISHLFDSSSIPSTAGLNMIKYFDNFVMEIMKNQGVRGIYQSRLFHRFLKVASSSNIQALIDSTDYVSVLLSDETQKYGIANTIIIMTELESYNEKIYKAIDVYNEELLSRLPFIIAIFYKFLGLTSFPNLMSVSRIPHHVSIVRKLLRLIVPNNQKHSQNISTDSKVLNDDKKNNSKGRNEGQRNHGYYSDDAASPSDKVIECYHSILSQLLDAHNLKVQMEYLYKYLRVDYEHFHALFRRGLCKEIVETNV